MLHEQSRQALKRKAVNTRARAFFDRADRSLDFADVTVGRDYVHFDGLDVVLDALKLVVSVHVANEEAAESVNL